MKKSLLVLFGLLVLFSSVFAANLSVNALYYPDPEDLLNFVVLNAPIYRDNVYTGFLTPHVFNPIIAGTYTVQLAPYVNWTPASAVVTNTENNGTVIFGTSDEPLPVTLSYFSVGIASNNTISLFWTSQSESNLMGFYLLRSEAADLATATVVSPLIPGTNTSETQNYSYTDSDVYEVGTYHYWLQSTDYDGTTMYYGPVSIDYTLPVDGPPVIPTFTELKAVYPNPFNPQAFIPFSLKDAADVSLKIYNSRGQIVRDFNLGATNPGEYRIEWNGTDNNGQILANGIYYVRMQAGKEMFQRKAVLIK